MGKIMKNRIVFSVAIVVTACFAAAAQNAGGQPANQLHNSETAALAEPSAMQGSRAPSQHFLIGIDDLLSVNVWKEPEVSRSIPVRSDGKISLPLVGEVQAAGKTPLQLQQDITAKLRSYISDPEVTVMVQQINSQKFNILGQVAKPGSYPLVTGTTVLDAIATADGFRDFAKQKSVYILRKNANGTDAKIDFNYKEVISGKHPEENIQLQTGDTIIVP